MTLFAAAALGLLIGVVLGALGGGGAILTVPMLVFVLNQSAQEATTSSLIIVGLTAVIGALGHARAGNVRWRTGIGFGVAGIAAAYLGSQANRQVDEQVLLLGFAAVMVLAAAGMLTRHNPCATESASARGRDPSVPHRSINDNDPGGLISPARRAVGRGSPAGPATSGIPRTARGDMSFRLSGHFVRAAKILAAGLLVGFLTGFFGVGGGFVIVPALMLVLGFPMPAAVGTSLLVVAVNSAASLAARADHATFDWPVIVPFTIAAVAGTFGGQRVAERVSGTVLTRSFAVLLLLVAAFVGVHSALDLA